SSIFKSFSIIFSISLSSLSILHKIDITLSSIDDEFIIRGVPTTIPFFKAILEDPDFIRANFDTSFVDKKLKEFKFTKKKDPESVALAIAAAVAAYHGIK
ncbi:MAG TPA: hypothetical protein EYP03_06080, partial [Aquificae bacterium]|nr:hypothetical protein [Aquificota bacterium]